MPLPTVYFLMSLAFSFAAVVWSKLLYKNKKKVTRIQNLLSVLVIFKAISLLLRSFQLKTIAENGESSLLLDFFFYFILLCKNQLFFGAIAIIFRKFKLAYRAFILILPLQFVATIAGIVSQGLRDKNVEYSVWIDLFILLDIVCCILILIPVLSFGEKTLDSEDSLYKRKMKMYRNLYTTFVCYIFLTRIVA